MASLLQLFLLGYPWVSDRNDILHKVEDYTLNWGIVCWKVARFEVLDVPVDSKETEFDLFTHLSKFAKLRVSPKEKLAQLVDRLIDTIENFKSNSWERITTIVLQDCRVAASFRNQKTGL